MTKNSNILIELKNLSIYGNGVNGDSVQIVKDITLNIYSNNIIGIVGPSGAGKTTLLKGIALLNEHCIKGEYRFNKVKVLPPNKGLIQKIRKNIIFIHQIPVLFKGTVRYNIEYGFKLRKMEIDREYVQSLISSFRIDDILGRNVKSLSAGEKQRVCLLRAMAIKPQVLILDEPTQNLDPANIKIIEENIKQYCINYNGTVVIVTHNLFQAKRITNKLGILVNGKIIEYGNTSDLFTNPKNQITTDFLTGKSIF